MVTVLAVLAIAALIMTLINAANGKVPLWVPVTLLCIIALVNYGSALAK